MPNPKPRITPRSTDLGARTLRSAVLGSPRRAPTAVLSMALAATAIGAVVSGCGGEEDSEGICTSTEQFFAEKVWAPTISTTCIACHNPTGAAKDTSFVLAASSEAGYLERNLEVIRQVAELEKNGQSLILLKPSGGLAHEGGTVLESGSDGYQNLERLVQMLKEGNECETNKASFFAGVELAGPEVTLRKMTLALAARIPTDAEIAAVEKDGFDAFGAILDQLMTEEPFYDRLRENYNNLFLTDQYIDDDALSFLERGDEDEGNYYNPRWYEGMEGDADAAKHYGIADPNDVERQLERRTRTAVAREPVELITHVVRNNKPFSEVLTADYMMINPYSAKAWGVTELEFANDADPYEWKPYYRTDNVPLAGVLTSVVWLNRHPTTPTNRNRHRARAVYFDWLGTDILKTAERPLDPTQITDHNPTMNNPACTVCHAQLDPIAGAFLNYQGIDAEGDFGQADYYPEFVWYQDMRPPGFGSETIAFEDQPRGLPWLAQRVTKDPRFPLAVVYQAFRAFVGQEPMLPPADPNDPEFNAQFQAYLGQYYALSEIADNFAKSNFNFKQIVKDLVMSPYFRALNASPNAAADQVEKFGEIGTAHLLTPEELDRKIISVFGVPWKEGPWSDASDQLLNDDRYRILYGGINSRDVTQRIKQPNGIMANIVELMGNQMACRLVAPEFAIPAGERRFFGSIEPTFAPRDANGFEVSSAVSGIKETIRELHYKILGEKLEPSDPEVERTYQLFLQTWDAGYKAVQAGEEGEELDWQCGADRNYLTGEAFDEETSWETRGDALYTKRAWMAVFTYLITDYKFIHE